MTLTKIITDCSTGEITIVNLSADEIKVYEADLILGEQRKLAETQAAAAKAALLDKLGITADEFKTLLGGN